MAWLVLAAGALSPIKLDLIGEVYAPELVLPLVALIARFSANGNQGLREPVFTTLLMAGFVTMFGYAMSDLVQGTHINQLLRGWGRVGLVISDFICLAVIFGQDRRNLWWYTLGAGLGSILFLRLVVHAPLGLWKFGYAEPVLQASAALGIYLPTVLTSAWIALLGVFSMWTDFRSFAAVCLAVAALTWLRSGPKAGRLAGSESMVKLALAGAVVLGIVMITLSLTGGADSGRRSESDAGRRAAFETGLAAVIESPVIGYGSWANSPQVVGRYLDRVHELRGGKGQAPAQDKRVVFNPHSQILHAWYEGGILGSAFLLATLIVLVRQGGWMVMHRPPDALTPILLYIAIITAWNLFMSPFTAPHRLGIAMGAAVLVMLRIERRQQARHSSLAAPTLSAGSGLSPLPVMARNGTRQVQYARRSLRWKDSMLKHRMPKVAYSPFESSDSCLSCHGRCLASADEHRNHQHQLLPGADGHFRLHHWPGGESGCRG
jgi:O-antigen ligase